MLKRVTKFLMLTGISVTVAVAGVAAQRPGPFRGQGFPIPALERLDLSDDQKAELQKLFAERRESAGPLFEQTAQLERELHRALLNDPSDLETIRALTARIADAQKAQLEARVALEQRIIQMLTPEQRQQLADLQASMGERRRAPR